MGRARRKKRAKAEQNAPVVTPRKNPPHIFPRILPVKDNKGFQKRPEKPVLANEALRDGMPPGAIVPAVTLEKKTNRKPTRVARGCKKRPTENRSKGGNSRRFIPYCERRA